MKFHSPYQFINIRPAKAKIKYKNREKLSAIENKFVRHDYWAKDSLSGSITCTLTTVSPLVVGAKQRTGTEDESGIVSPYKHLDDSIAIPANSLRGMISSLAETISQSSLRVLSKKAESIYSVRQQAQAGKKVGLLLKDTSGEFRLYKLKDNHNNYSQAWMLSRNDVSKFSCQTYQHKNENTHKFYYAEKNKQGFLTKAHKFSDQQSNNKTKGITYIRGNVFDKKTHESFIPWNGKVPESGTLVTEQVNRFQTTLQQYADNPENSLPVGYKPGKNEKRESVPVVRDGDLVYYSEDTRGNIELSYSQIWRNQIPGNLHDNIEEGTGDKDSLPWGSTNRSYLTPAEALFGVVESKEEKNATDARNLASRVQFTDAVAEKKITLDKPVILKILDSPKPPSPSMYFHSQKGNIIETGCIEKQHLDLTRNNPKHLANGRKHYLPHHPNHALHSDRPDWQSRFTEDDPPTGGNNKENWKQYLKVKPIPAASAFEFQIHFDNISKAELGLLQTSLQPTNADGKFLHRLGLGKPLGLGSIKLEIKTIKIIARQQRYNLEGLNASRETEYTSESIDKSYIDEATLKELTLLYNPDNIKHPVCYPFNSADEQNAGDEGEGFSWFVLNDKIKDKDIKQQLLPVDTSIPVLDSFSNYLRLKYQPYAKPPGKLNQLNKQIEQRYHGEIVGNKIFFPANQSVDNLMNKTESFKVETETFKITFCKETN